MHVVSADNECLLDRLHVAVDQDAEPSDWDDVLAGFLLNVSQLKGTDHASDIQELSQEVA